MRPEDDLKESAEAEGEEEGVDGSEPIGEEASEDLQRRINQMIALQ